MSSAMNGVIRRVLSAAALAAAAGVAASAVAAPGDIANISVSSSGAFGDADADQGFPDCTPDGRYITFASGATNLVAGNTIASGIAQVYRRDRLTNTTVRVSVASDGSEPTGLTYANASTISDDGRFIAFDTDGDFAGIADGDVLPDVYLKDMTSGALIKVSHALGGGNANHIGGSFAAWVDATGAHVAYESDASNIVATDTNAQEDAFYWTRATNVNQLASVTAGGLQGDGISNGVVLSGDGRYVGYDGTSGNHGSSNLNGEVYRKDMVSGALIICSVAQGGGPNNGTQTLIRDMSANGDVLAFLSNDPALTADPGVLFRGVYVRQVTAGNTILCSKADDGTAANGTTGSIGLSSDGNVVSYRSTASNLVAGDTNGVEDVFATNISAARTQRCSTAADGTESNGGFNRITCVNGDGTLVTFWSDADNLVAGDTNLVGDFFAKEITWATGVPGLCEYDLNGDGSVDQSDVDCMVAVVAGDPTCVRGDVPVELDKNQDGSVDQGDVSIVVDVVAGGPAPGC